MNNNDEILNEEGQESGIAAPSSFGEGLSFVNPAEMPDLEEAEEGFNIQPESLEFINAGDRVRAVYTGTTTLQVKDKTRGAGHYIDREAVVLQTKTGIKINMGANLVKQLKMLPNGTPVQITYKGTQETKSGNDVKVYEVVTLKVPGLKVAPVSRQITPPSPKVEFKNSHRASEYWNAAYNIFRFTEQEGKDHLALFHNDFAAAIDALKDFDPQPFQKEG